MDHFLPLHERKKFSLMAKGVRSFDDGANKITDNNKGHQLLSKLGWQEGMFLCLSLLADLALATSL